MEFLVILFFFGLSAGVVAKIKGSSFVLWFLIGFCLPFFGTLAALLTRNERQMDVRECEECGNVVPIHDQVCSRCGADLEFLEASPGEGDGHEVPRGQERLFEA